MTTWEAMPDKEGQRVIVEFIKRLEATGCTDVTVKRLRVQDWHYPKGETNPVSQMERADGRLAISAVAPKWGMGDRGWKAWHTTRDLKGYRNKTTGEIQRKYPDREFIQWEPVVGPKHPVKRRVYYQFWPKGYQDGTTRPPINRAMVRSRWDLQPAGEDGRYRCRWCTKRIPARRFAKHAGHWEINTGACPVKMAYLKIYQTVRNELDAKTPKAPDKDYAAQGQRNGQLDKQTHNEALRRARAKVGIA